MGFLIVQELSVVIAMMAMSALRGSGESGADVGGYAGWAAVLLSLSWRLAAAAVAVFVVMHWVLPAVVSAMARWQELLLVFAIAWGVALAALGEWAGFSKEAGAFLAGFSLASTPYRGAMNARLTGIRDFLLLFFFIDLGAKLDFSTLGAEVVPAIELSLFVSIGNPLIVRAIMGFMGYRRRTCFLAGLTLAQNSEFSIVFVAMGIKLGHVGVQALGLTTLVGRVTITVSTYMNLYTQALNERLSPWLRIFERDHPFREVAAETQDAGTRSAQVIVFGLGRYGDRLFEQLRADGVAAIGVDFDPEAVRELRGRGLPVHFGDGEDPDFLESLPLRQARWMFTTFPQWESNCALLHALKAVHCRGRVMAAVRDAAHGRALAEAGIDQMLNPFDDAADHAAQRLSRDIRTETTP